MTFQFLDCVAPMSLDDFVSCIDSSPEVRCIPGNRDRFRSLLTVEEVNELLSRMIVYEGMMRLSNGRRFLAPNEFLIPVLSNSRYQHRIRSESLKRAIGSGGTLQLHFCQGWFSAVAAFATFLESTFSCPVHADLFAAGNGSVASGVHWDEQDMLICQIRGKKFWPIFERIEENHMSGSSTDRSSITNSKLSHEITLEEGDILYVPRGWPHNPKAVDGPSLHLAFGIFRPTEVDILRAAVEAASARGNIQRLVPRWGAGREQCVAFEAQLRGNVDRLFNEGAVNAYRMSEHMRVNRPLCALEF
jgi:hypothetical protein